MNMMSFGLLVTPTCINLSCFIIGEVAQHTFYNRIGKCSRSTKLGDLQNLFIILVSNWLICFVDLLQSIIRFVIKLVEYRCVVHVLDIS